MAAKFDEHDRGKVIAYIEASLSVCLKRVGRHRKFLEDGEGRSYWILGGYEDWHGITAGMRQEEQRRSSNGILVVAKRLKNKIDVFSGSLQQLIDHCDQLSHTQKDDDQFHISIRESLLTINEIPDLKLTKVCEI